MKPPPTRLKSLQKVITRQAETKSPDIIALIIEGLQSSGYIRVEGSSVSYLNIKKNLRRLTRWTYLSDHWAKSQNIDRVSSET